MTALATVLESPLKVLWSASGGNILALFLAGTPAKTPRGEFFALWTKQRRSDNRNAAVLVFKNRL